MLDATRELSHAAFTVGDLDEPMQVLLGGTVGAASRDICALASSPPFELWEEAEGSPWHVSCGPHCLHHLSYRADGLVRFEEQCEGGRVALAQGRAAHLTTQ